MSSPAAPLIALGASSVLGTSDFLGGLLTRRLPALVVVAWSHLGSFAVLAAALLATGLPSTMGWLGWAVLAGVGSGLGLLAFYTALSIGTVGVVSSLATLGVVIPVGMALLAGERPAPLQYLGIGAAVLGAVLASGPEVRHEERHRARAVGLALASAVAFGVMDVGIVRGAQVANLATLCGMRATSGLALGLVALLTGRLRGVGGRDVTRLTLLGTLDVLGNGLIGLSTSLGMVSVNVVLSSLYPVATIALAAVFLRERLRAVQALGVSLALAGVVAMHLAG